MAPSGRPEATRSDNQMYGMERLVQALNDHRQDTPKQILEGVHQSINEFVGEAPQFDDLTMLCLELKEKE